MSDVHETFLNEQEVEESLAQVVHVLFFFFHAHFQFLSDTAHGSDRERQATALRNIPFLSFVPIHAS